MNDSERATDTSLLPSAVRYDAGSAPGRPRPRQARTLPGEDALRPAWSRPDPAALDMGELASLGSLPLRARRLADAAGVGLHRSRRRGASVEFADYRDYQPGDDLRRVDWRLFGRTDRLQIRNAHEETPLRVQLVLDVSASMSYASRPGLLTKLDLARCVLGGLALLTRRQRDACGLSVVADDLLFHAAPSASPARLRAVWGALESPPLQGPTALAAALTQAAEVAPRSCLFVIASDFYEEPAALEEVVHRLRFERQDVLALHLVDPAEVRFDFSDPAQFEDVETAARLEFDPVVLADAYRAAFAAHQRALDDIFCGNGFDYLVLRTDESPLAAFAAYLARRAGRA